MTLKMLRNQMRINTRQMKTKPLPSLVRSIIIVLILTAQLGCTATTLPPYEATYTTKLRGVKISGTRKFESTGSNTYKVSWKAKALWMRLNEWSEFELINGKQIRPISYHYTRKGLGTDKPIHIIFDWENNVINAKKGDKDYQFALEPNTLDRLSYQVQMQIDLLVNPDSQQLNYTVANHDRLAHYEFNYENQALIKTELGSAESLIFKREKKYKTTRIWLSPEQFYVPVKIEQTEDEQSSVIAIKNWKSQTDKVARGALSFNMLNRNNHSNKGINFLHADAQNDQATQRRQTTNTPSIDNTEFDGDF